MTISEPILKTINGYYCGTRVSNSWWKWYRPWGFFTRGNGTVWIDSAGIHFRLYLTSRVRDLPAASIKNIKVGDCGFRWLGAPVIWIEWTDGSKNLLSGFAVSKSKDETERWVNVLAALSRNA
jgi:hypothetical protein